MTIVSKQNQKLLALGAGLLSLGACASSVPTAVIPGYLEGTALSRHEIAVTKRTEFLEVVIHPEASELSGEDRVRIRNFIGAYAQSGHGPLVLSLPAASANPQLAVTAISEARTIAWEKGIEYDEIAGTAHGAGEAYSQPMLLAFQVYDAVAPDCPSLAFLDFADASSNNSMPSIGCSIRSNLAAMIADPADLLGNRPIGPSDMLRRQVILEKFRLGEPTAAMRLDQESGAVSDAVN